MSARENGKTVRLSAHVRTSRKHNPFSWTGLMKKCLKKKSKSFAKYPTKKFNISPANPEQQKPPTKKKKHQRTDTKQGKEKSHIEYITVLAAFLPDVTSPHSRPSAERGNASSAGTAVRAVAPLYTVRSLLESRSELFDYF